MENFFAGPWTVLGKKAKEKIGPRDARGEISGIKRGTRKYV